VILGLTDEKDRLVTNDTPIKHGTRSTYLRHKCKCEPCKAAQSEYSRKRRGEPKPKPGLQHGTRTGYSSYKCRCDECKAAQAEYHRSRYTPRPRQSQPLQHGTRNGYQSYKCRCEPCKDAQREYARTEKKRDSSKTPHGTVNGYKHYGCRCDECAPLGRASARKFPKKIPDRPIPHGTVNGYTNYKCRCDDCNAAMRERARLEYRKNPDRSVESANRRRARMRDAFVEDVPRREIFERDNWQCQIPGCLYPGIPASLDAGRYHPLLASVDHIVPYAKGGLHERSNLATAHLRCNKAKNDRLEGIA
jgi:hypothetical protein